MRSAYPVPATGLAQLLIGIAHLTIKTPTVLATVILVLRGSITYTISAPHANASCRIGVGPVWITDVKRTVACAPRTCTAILDKGIAPFDGRTAVPAIGITRTIFVSVRYAIAIDITSACTLRACVERAICARALGIRSAGNAKAAFADLALFLTYLDIGDDATLAHA